MSISLTRKHYTNINKVEKILEQRTRETFKLDGINKIFFDKDNKLNFRFIVRESDEYQLGIYSNDLLKEWYLPKHAFSQLASYLNIPVRTYDFINLANPLMDTEKRLDSNERDLFLENISENLEILCKNRIEREKNSKRLQKHYITVFSDLFGTFIRRISSEIYKPYEDYKALIDTNTNLQKVNKAKGTSYEHTESYISPNKLTSNFVDSNYKIHLKNIDDTIKGGITMTNSETKDSSFGFQALIFRLECTNGMVSTFKDQALTVKHIGREPTTGEKGKKKYKPFSVKTIDAFIKILELGANFSKMFVELERSKPISNDWNDIYELPDTLFQMRKNERKELITIARKESYPFSAYGIVQALTFKSNHDAISDSKFKTLNEKAIDVSRKVDKFNKFTPKRFRNKEVNEKVSNQNSFDISDLSFADID